MCIRDREKGIAVIGVNYRLSPRVNAAKAIEDAAAATAWVFKNIKNYGGDENLIFISGHSAGGYLASMVALNKDYLAKYNIDANRLAGIIPFSGHTITPVSYTHLDVYKRQDLLLRTNELLTRFPEVLAKYQDRFRYILVDEYQDTCLLYTSRCV